MTSNQKIDRRALGDTPEMTPTVCAVTTSVARVLGVSEVDPHATFLDLGGSSLSALEVIARTEALGLPLTTEALLAAPSFTALARQLDGEPKGESVTVAELGARAAPLLGELPHITAGDVTAPPGVVLVTGATGFLGARIVAELLQTTPARVVCLARGRERPAHERVTRALSNLDAPLDALEVVEGDLTKPRLGLDEREWSRLARQVDHVVHAAARVSVTAPYEVLHPANVEGTARVLALASASRRKRLTHASTLSVFVSTDDAEGCFAEDRELRPDARVFGGYAQTKVAAEHLVRAAAPHLAGTQTIRFGLLTGESATGRMVEGGWLPRTIRGLSTLGVLPEVLDPDLSFDVTPVDYAAAVTGRLVFRATDEDVVFHVAGEAAAPLSLLRQAMDDEGVTLREVPSSTFLARVAESLETESDADVGAACLALGRALGGGIRARHRGLDLFEATRARFDTSRTRTMIEDDLRCPTPTRALLRSYVRASLGGRS
jgi:thioester reductase-like protein